VTAGKVSPEALCEGGSVLAPGLRPAAGWPRLEPVLIGVDIDNVLAEFEAAFRAWINRHAGLSLQRRHITRFRFSECCPLSPEQVGDLFRSFVEDGGLRRLSLIPNARRSLQALSGRAEVCLVTSRPPQGRIVEDTRFWLERKGLPHARLLFAERKWELAEEFSLFVEDNLDQAQGLAQRGVRVLLLDYPWNRNGAAHPNVTRIPSWRKVIDTL
jgi:uncharacterized HAD superfamily protein